MAGKQLAQILAIGSATAAIGTGIMVGRNPELIHTHRADVLRLIILSLAVFAFAMQLLRGANDHQQ